MFFPKMGIRRSVVPMLIPFLTILFLTGCKYDAPGNDGTAPTGTPARSITYTSKSAPATTEVICGTRYRVNVQVSQTVESCAGYNFSALRQRALDLANARMAQLACPTGTSCPVSYLYFTHWRWNCTGTTATVRTRANVLCQGASDAAPQSVTDGTGFDFTQPGNQKASSETGGFTPGEEGELIEDNGGSAPLTWAMGCPSTTLLMLTYREKDPTGTAPENHAQDYKGYVDRADAKARMIHAQYNCLTNCNKQTYRALYTSWAFNPPTSEVVVTIHFEVECKKP